MSQPLRGLGPLTRAYLLQTLRSRTALFWNLLFPLVWLFLSARPSNPIISARCHL